jgi:hypothetical protein
MYDYRVVNTTEIYCFSIKVVTETTVTENIPSVIKP